MDSTFQINTFIEEYSLSHGGLKPTYRQISAFLYPDKITRKDNAVAVAVSLSRFGLGEVALGSKPGFVYLAIALQLDDVYKIGRSSNPYRRLNDFISEYGEGFRLIKRFAVPDMVAMENVALQLTKSFSYCTGKGREFRRMTPPQLQEFIESFREICRIVVDK